ncbi:MAG: DNA helicase PcrA [Actinobacteria bacterium]|nr:DNA helicase PcrA [Actinomycetota bacterium]
MDILANLNPEQREAASYLGGPLLILAGAGSGKTRVLTHRIAYLLEQGVSPFNILAITFTNKAAGEMKGRVEKLVGPVSKSIWVSTFHSACVRMLRRDIDKLGYEGSFVILDTDDQKTVVKECMKELDLSDKQFNPNAVLGSISNAKNELLGPEAFERRARDYFSQRTAQVYRLYQKKLRQNNALDFDDLIMKTVELLQARPDVLQYYQDKFHQVLVDEYQDTNHAQYVLVKLLAAKYRNLCVVGDDDQSVYSFRGANIRNILDFERDYPDAKVVKLEQNYRSTQKILSAAYHVVKNNFGRKDKRLWTKKGEGVPVAVYDASNEHDEAWFICNEIERLAADEGRKLSDFAVLYRTHAQSRVLEEVFLRRRIPYVIVGGLKFYDRKEIKDLIAYLRLLVNPRDLLAFRRVVNVPKRGLGPASLEKIEALAAEKDLPIVEAARRAAEAPDLTRAAASKMAAFGDLLAVLQQQSRFLPLAELVSELLERSGYLIELQAEGTIEAATRVENIKEFQSVVQEFLRSSEDTSLGAFLESVALVADADTFKEGADAVPFMTLHSAKGLEFPVTFLAGMEEGVFPHLRALTEEKELEEERRLCYVGMTRAEERLYLTHAWERTIYGNTLYNSVSRFIEEIPRELIAKPGETKSIRMIQTTALRAPVPGAAQSTAGRAPAGPADRGLSPGAVAVVAGEKVRHPKWGPGTVVSVRGEGEEAEITLAFPAPIGVKKVIAKYALLEK